MFANSDEHRQKCGSTADKSGAMSVDPGGNGLCSLTSSTCGRLAWPWLIVGIGTSSFRRHLSHDVNPSPGASSGRGDRSPCVPRSLSLSFSLSPMPHRSRRRRRTIDVTSPPRNGLRPDGRRPWLTFVINRWKEKQTEPETEQPGEEIFSHRIGRHPARRIQFPFRLIFRLHFICVFFSRFQLCACF